MSAIGTKRTFLVALHMSAFDPKRTWCPFARQPAPAVDRHSAALIGDQFHLNQCCGTVTHVVGTIVPAAPCSLRTLLHPRSGPQ